MTDYERGFLAGLEEAARMVVRRALNAAAPSTRRAQDAAAIRALAKVPPTVVVVDAESYRVLQTQHRDLMRDGGGR